MVTSPPLHPDAALERVATGATWTEGPVWLAARGSVRFSDIPSHRILEFNEETGAVTVFDEDAEFTNGRSLALDGSVIECCHGRRAVQRETAVRPGETPAPQTLVERFGNMRLNSPNDVVVKSDGTIWFSDPSYGIQRPDEGYPGHEEYGDRYVFRFNPDDGSIQPVVIDIEAPNGLAFSPDEKILYVADSSASPMGLEIDPHRPRKQEIRAYDIIDNRHAKNGRLFTEVTPGPPDGIRVDQHGNIWSSSQDSIQVFSPTGEPILQIPVPERVSNLCFGGQDGRTLYITASSSLYRIRTTTADATVLARKFARQ